jgi:DNA excision repair protein ERCC-2
MLDEPGDVSSGSPPGRVVSVRALCAFAARCGDLDLRFTPAPSALEGIEGHRLVQGRRGAGYRCEVPLSGVRHGLLVRGRADGVDIEAARLEEIKTFRGRFDAIRANQRELHWAQAKVYAAMLCQQHSLSSIRIALVYLDIESEAEHPVEDSFDAPVLEAFFDRLCAAYAQWALQEQQHRTQLDDALGRLAFPEASFRVGQHELASRVFQVSKARRCLLAQAPTGIGKTLATLFPLLRSKARERIDKIFFLAAKTPGRAIALDALRRLRDVQGGPRVLELASRESACVHPGSACHGDACRLARGFYDRLPQARAHAAALGWLDQAALRETARQFEVCPYFLAQEMARWADVIVGDYNYYFDPSAFLFAMTKEDNWQVAVLVDEAHNLVERGRAMYSCELSDGAFDAARAMAPADIRRALSKVVRQWALLGDAAAPRILDHVPEPLARAVVEANALLADHLAAQPQHAVGPVHECFFQLLRFARLTESFGPHSVLAVEGGGGQRRVEIRNLIPASHLRPRFAACRTAICFSGTLAPFDYYRDTLGLPANTATVDVASPFSAEQLEVRIAVDLSARLRDRAGSLRRLVRVMADQYRSRPGNYLAFFSSFEHLASAALAFAGAHPDIPTWQQARNMTGRSREAFLERFQAGGCGIGFAVLGGAFGEAVDLPGDRLFGAFVAGLGLPPADALNEATRERMQERFGDGYRYTYLYPALQKVAQAAGRVIRSETDRGVLYLLDDRFARPEVLGLLPAWWRPSRWHAATLSPMARAADRGGPLRPFSS